MPNQSSLRILIVDDQPSIGQLCATIGRGMGLDCSSAESAEEALRLLQSESPEVVLADLVMGGMSGLELLAEVKRLAPRTEVALMSAYGTIECAVEAMRLGAYDFIVKPFRVDEFKLMLRRMVEKVRLVKENAALQVMLESEKSAAAPCTDLEELERRTVQRVFELVEGDKERARTLLGISRATLYRKIKLYGIEPVRRRGGAPRAGVPASGIRRTAKRVIVLTQS